MLSVIMFSMRAAAQSSLLATLNHEGTISTFYGSSALKEAYNAAANGDVITLSSGSFLGTDIKKAITLRGAGMQVDTVHHTEPTVISTEFTLDVDTLSGRFTMEGIYTNQYVYIKTLKNAMFLKCRFSYVSKETNSSLTKDLNFIHCKIAGNLNLPSEGSAYLNNCVVYAQSNDATFSFINCYVTTPYISNSEFKNCIIVGISSGSSSSTYYNNLFIRKSESAHLNAPNNTNVELLTTDSQASYLDMTYNDDNDYKLTDELKALIKGTDGTEVGIYGGSLPYDPTPSNPQITKFNVASKSTADGKLSVDIEVSSEN